MRTLQEMADDAAVWDARDASVWSRRNGEDARAVGERLAGDVAGLLRVLRAVYADHDGTYGGRVRRDGSKPRVCFRCRTLWPCPTARVLLEIPGMPVGSEQAAHLS